MKKVLLLLLFALPFMGFSQQIKSVVIDKFTKEKRIQTDDTPIYGQLMSLVPNRVHISYRSVGKTAFLTLMGVNTAAGVIGDDDRLIFLFEDDETISLSPTGIQGYDTRSGGNMSSTKVYEHQYHISLGDVEKLSNKEVKSVRRTYDKYYKDMDVKKSFAESLRKLTQAFHFELSKEYR